MINTAIIGCGVSARTFHLPLIAANPAYRVTALVSSREQPDLDIPRYPDTTAMLAAGNAELVIIAAPNAVHYDLATQCLEAGCHVVLEKPMINTLSEGRALIRLAAEKQRLLSVFHNRRWDSDYLTLKKLLTDGELGAPHLFISRWDRYRPQVRDRWRETPGAGTGVWYDLGAHLLDQALDLFGLPQAVTSHCRALRPGCQTVDYAHVELHYPTHEVVLHTSPYCNAPVTRYHLEGEHATFVKYGLDPQEAQLKAGMTPHDPAYGIEPAAQHGTLYTKNSSRSVAGLRGDFPAYYANIAAAIHGEAPLTVTAAQALCVIYLIELAQKSSDEGRCLPVTMPD